LLASIITAISQNARRRNGHVADNLSDRTRKLAPESAHVFTRVKYSAESVGRAALRKQTSIAAAAAAAAGRRYIHSVRAQNGAINHRRTSKQAPPAAQCFAGMGDARSSLSETFRPSIIITDVVA